MTTNEGHTCFGACPHNTEQLPVDSIIRIMENKAYSLARQGHSEATNALFIAVAALEKCRDGDPVIGRIDSAS